ncbi:hypothetical protein NP233_g6264 [Leucocoprinus birnbaumii]|uniref:Uncharacterized protein n=1 Tax=Leucocoprinus birnbaumii TaxID=56174 RepID=A0AAD5YTU1_9AGAR|nr:hypothetical protein NP233_g6264 [Leucocoprinus birnbaumii]
MQVKSILRLTSIATLALAANVDDALPDLELVATQGASLQSAITAFPSMAGIADLSAALSIHATAISVITTLNETKVNAQTVPTPVSLADGTQVLDTIDGMKPTVEGAFAAAINKKDSFKGLFGDFPGPTAFDLLRQGLLNINSSAVALGDLLGSIVPSEIRAEAFAIGAEISGALTQAIAVYSC